MALSDDATEAPPQDRAWFRILDDAERASVDSDLEQAARISERLHQGPVNDTLFRARVLESHGLTGETLALLREEIGSLTGEMGSDEVAPLVRYEQNLSASVEAAWQPGTP